MRGRVMALYSIVFLGSTPIGGPIAGWLSQAIDPRAALVLPGASGVIAAVGARAAFARASAATPRHAGERPCEAIPPARPRGVRRRRRRMAGRHAIAPQPGCPDQLDRLQGRGRLDVEAHPVALLDRGHRPLAVSPRRARSGSRSPRRPRRPGETATRARRRSSAKAPIGHSRRNAIRPGLSVGSEVAVRADASARDIASPARGELPRRAPRTAASVHQPPAKISVA